MNQVDTLTELLQRLSAGEDPANLRQEARRFLASIDPQDLSLAEQKLMEAGLAPEDLQHLCSTHLEMLREEALRGTADLENGHVISTMMREHEKILGFLNELQGINEAVQNAEGYDDAHEELDGLRSVAEHLVGAEPHHQREEEVLFPRLEERGVFGPPQIMRMEHVELRRRKEELMELAESGETMNFETFKRRLDAAVRFLVPMLRDHIFKEDNILYPTALQVITDGEEWRDIAVECDRIGHCCFTPEAEATPSPVLD